MNWIKNFVRPKIRSILGAKPDSPDNIWVKCPETGQMVFYKDLEANLQVIPGSGYHMRMTPKQRLTHMFGDSGYTLIDLPRVTDDPMSFRDKRRYGERLREARQNCGNDDAVVAAYGELDELEVVVTVQDFAFMGGSLGMAAGEAIITSMQTAAERGCPLILFAASGGARMQEGILSLMQMPRTTVARQALSERNLPYVVVLTHPTTGGVTASYAMLGDIHLAEPGALIGFAGPRVIEQTIREQLPDGFQRAESVHAHGMVDAVVHRHELRQILSRICRILMRRPALEAVPETLSPAALPAPAKGRELRAPETRTETKAGRPRSPCAPVGPNRPDASDDATPTPPA